MTVLVIDPTAKYRCSLEAAPSAPSLARTFLAQLLDLWGVDPDSADSALLLLSELVTNAFRHAARPSNLPPGQAIPPRLIVIGAKISTTILYVEVWDGSPDLPTLLHAADDDEQWRGLGIVATLAHRWGSAPAPLPPRGIPGKIVYFELRLPVPPKPRSARPENEPASQPGIPPAAQRPAAPAQPPQAEPLPRRQHRRAPVAHPPPRQPQPVCHAPRYDTGHVAAHRLETALRSIHPQPA